MVGKNVLNASVKSLHNPVGREGGRKIKSKVMKPPIKIEVYSNRIPITIFPLLLVLPLLILVFPLIQYIMARKASIKGRKRLIDP